MPTTTIISVIATGNVVSTLTEVVSYQTGPRGSTTTAKTSTLAPTSTQTDTISSVPPSSSSSPPGTISGSSSLSSIIPTSSSTVVPVGNNNGVSSGAVAGAAVGCLIAGALIAFLVAFLIFRKRSQRNTNAKGNRRDYHGDRMVEMTDEPTSKLAAGAVADWERFLPQSADDRSVQNDVRTFLNLVDLHVDNFYRKTPSQMEKSSNHALSQVDSGKLPGRIDDLLADQSLVPAVIKNCIANLLITRMFPQPYPEHSLLPAHVAAMPTKLQSTSLSSSEGKAAHQAYRQWRLLSAYLFPHPEENPRYVEDCSAKANEISDLLSSAFAPWQVANRDKGEMQQHEKGLVTTAANLGVLLTSQPSTLEFRWSTEHGEHVPGGYLIALPGFWRVSDERGYSISQAQLLVPPVILRV